jgi:hypothetical protein
MSKPTGKALAVVLKKQIPWENITSCLCNAFEGGANYWYFIEAFKKPKNFDNSTEFEKDFRHLCYPVNEGGALVITCEQLGDEAADEHRDGEKFKKFLLNIETITKGIAVMAEKYPRHFANLDNEEGGDGETGDVFLQCCLFSEIIYG